MNNILALIKLMRIHQWHKNGFVILGVFVLGDYGNYSLLIKAAVMFTAFCFASSSVYILNDYLDIDADRKHPYKKKRPLASGAIKPGPALLLS